MLYKNINVQFVNPIIYLGEISNDNWKENENIVSTWLYQNNIDARVECSIDDLVYIYLEEGNELNIELLTEIYNKAKKNFKEVAINLHLDGFIEGEGNSIDLSLDEFLEMINQNKIIVKCIEEFKIFNSSNNLLADVEVREYEAILKESYEYFAKDSEGRDFLVGELDSLGNVVLEDEFILL